MRCDKKRIQPGNRGCPWIISAMMHAADQMSALHTHNNMTSTVQLVCILCVILATDDDLRCTVPVVHDILSLELGCRYP